MIFLYVGFEISLKSALKFPLLLDWIWEFLKWELKSRILINSTLKFYYFKTIVSWSEFSKYILKFNLQFCRILKSEILKPHFMENWALLFITGRKYFQIGNTRNSVVRYFKRKVPNALRFFLSFPINFVSRLKVNKLLDFEVDELSGRRWQMQNLSTKINNALKGFWKIDWIFFIPRDFLSNLVFQNASLETILFCECKDGKFVCND